MVSSSSRQNNPTVLPCPSTIDHFNKQQTMPPKPIVQLTAEEYAARVARAEHIKSEIARLDKGLNILTMEIQQEGAAAAAQHQQAGAAQGTYHHPNDMPGAYIHSASSASSLGEEEEVDDGDADSITTEVPAHHPSDNETIPPTSIAAKYALVARLHADLAAKDYCTALAHCVEILAHIQEDLALHVVYLDTVANRNGTELAVARLAMADAGLVVGEGRGVYCSETENEDVAGTDADDEGNGDAEYVDQ